MKHKKGFTMVELLAVITIIGILALMIYPTIERLTKENTKKVYEQQLNNIVLSLKSWASDNREFLPSEENENLTITLGNLKSEGYIEYEVKNPLTGNCFDNGMALIITRVNKNYDYSIDLDTIKESDVCEIDVDSPTIMLNGNMIENIEVNSVYIDKGVSAKDQNGNDITNDVITTITGAGNVVDTSEIGNQYVITYSVSANDVTVQVSRTIKIVDTIAPDLIIPNNIVIDSTVTSIDIMDGVSATDNSGEDIEVTTKGSVNFGVVGKYIITYTAKDSSGNTTIKKRAITINEIMSSDSNCIKDVAVICPSGTLVNVRVNEKQTYNFYVIKDTGTTLTLIMDKNLGENIPWVSKADYNDDVNYGSYGNSSKGPITAIKHLDELTDEEWSNIPARDYTYSGIAYDGTTRKYEDITKTMRARMLTYAEATTLGCNVARGSCPDWLYSNLYTSSNTSLPVGYWTSTANAADTYLVWYIPYDGAVNGHVLYDPRGVRPVIELDK